jgi:hypothetical protein
MPGTNEWRDRCLVTLARIARELIANRRVRIRPDVTTANVINIVRSLIRMPRPNVRISSRIGIDWSHLVARRMMRRLGERRRRQSNEGRGSKYCLGIHRHQLRFGLLDCVMQPAPELGSKVPYCNAQIFDALHKQLIEPGGWRASN